MKEPAVLKEPEIKLFGQKILLPEYGGAVSAAAECSGESCSGSGDRCSEGEAHHDDEKQLHAHEEDQEGEECETRMQVKDENVGAKEETAVLPELDDEDAASESSNPKPENGQKPALKKPDKILPCPRCNSMDTKFCYYNNYNINQPRHFCKSCQRYWTAGGTMRNVPVGAGRRKNKNPAPPCRHISISEALQAVAAARVDVPNGFHHPAFRPNGTVLSFGPDCESMADPMGLSDKRASNGVKISISGKKGANRDSCLKGSSDTTWSSVGEDGNNVPPQLVKPNLNGVPYPIPCIPGVAWPIPWNPAMPLPGRYPPSYPMPVYPAPYWNCGTPNPWNVPWVPTPSPVVANQNGGGSHPNSPLGKHARNGELLQPSNLLRVVDLSKLSEGSERSILVPKTLRIDDPKEAAKSSIWETLGIKCDSVSREGLFKALQPKGDEKKLVVSSSPVLQANPAAMSRSMSFQEGA